MKSPAQTAGGRVAARPPGAPARAYPQSVVGKDPSCTRSDVRCGDCQIGRHAIYGPTLAAEPATICRIRSNVRAVPTNHTLMRAGETPLHVHTLRSGWAYRFVQLPDRRRQIFAFFVPGDTICLEALHFAGRPLPFSVRCLTPAVVCSFKLADMQIVLAHGEDQRARAAGAMHDYWGAMDERLVSIGRRRARGRIARLLIEIEERLAERGLSSRGAFEFPVRQDHIADALGLTPIHVNRTLSALKRQGILDFQRGQMNICDANALRRVADEE